MLNQACKRDVAKITKNILHDIYLCTLLYATRLMVIAVNAVLQNKIII
jgi:hypothetical protein